MNSQFSHFCSRRVFALANKKDEIEVEMSSMASLLAKFRIDYSDLELISDIAKKADDSTYTYFNDLIRQFMKKDNSDDSNGGKCDFEQKLKEKFISAHIFLNSYNHRKRSSDCQRQNQSLSSFARASDQKFHFIGLDCDDIADAAEKCCLRPIVHGMAGEPESWSSAIPIRTRKSIQRTHILLLILIGK